MDDLVRLPASWRLNFLEFSLRMYRGKSSFLEPLSRANGIRKTSWIQYAMFLSYRIGKLPTNDDVYMNEYISLTWPRPNPKPDPNPNPNPNPHPHPYTYVYSVLVRDALSEVLKSRCLRRLGIFGAIPHRVGADRSFLENSRVEQVTNCIAGRFFVLVGMDEFRLRQWINGE